MRKAVDKILVTNEALFLELSRHQRNLLNVPSHNDIYEFCSGCNWDTWWTNREQSDTFNDHIQRVLDQ